MRLAEACCRVGSLLLLWLPASAAQAHSFGKVYNLPVPFWLYAWASAAALLLSFLVVAWFSTARSADLAPRSHVLDDTRWPPLLRRLPILTLLRTTSLAALLLCVSAALIGPRDPYLNFSMTFFWIGFVLALPYLTALAGGLYAVANPWRLLTRGVERLAAGAFSGRLRYPPALGCWPALALYMGFIWLELFSHGSPRTLALMLLAYTVINLAGAWLLGAQAWFRHGEFFSVFLRLLGRMAPLSFEAPEAGGRLRMVWRMPLAGLLQERATHLSEVLFILFMLSSTAFDGLHVTEVWTNLLWVGMRDGLMPWLGGNIVTAYPVLKVLHQTAETLALLLSPFLYLAVYLFCLALARRMGGSTLSLQALALRFGYSLLPIALVYHISHYFTLLITQGPQILWLASDPFGRGWNLFGSGGAAPAGIVPDMGWVWHTQVGLILAGHIASVWLAHVEALRSFATPRQALLSQLPMLLLMMAFTVFGLWILAQPITSGGG